MIREIKKQAWEIRSLNYKKFLPPLLLYIAAKAAVYLITNVLTLFGRWEELHIDLQILILAVFLLIELAAIPIITTVLIKICLDCISCSAADTSVKNFLSKQNIKKIIIINLIHSIINVFYVAAKAPVLSCLNIFGLKRGGIAEILLTLLNQYIWYRIFICNYIFIQNGGSAREILFESLKVMKRKFLKYLLLDLSFFPWVLLFSAVLMLAAFIIFLTLSLTWVAVVVGGVITIAMILFLTPYMYLAEVLFIRSSIAEEKTKRWDEYYGDGKDR